MILGWYWLNFYVMYLDMDEIFDCDEIEYCYFVFWVDWVKD